MNAYGCCVFRPDLELLQRHIREDLGSIGSHVRK
jgi:hypothetical protein